MKTQSGFTLLENAKEISPYIASTFYAADRYATFKTGLEEYYNNGGIILAEPTPEAIASAIAYIIDNPKVAQEMSNFGKEYMKDYPLEKGFEQFLKAVKDMLDTDYNQVSEIEPLYKKKKFLATEEAIKCSEELLKQQPVYVDNHGDVYRFLSTKIYLKQ